MRCAAALVLVLVSGCASPPEQTAAERVVGERTGTSADCTSRSRIWFREGPPAEVFVCVANRDHGLCDRYRVDRDRDRYRITLLAARSDCSLPAG